MISILQTFELSQNNIKSASKSKEDHGSKDSTTFSRMMCFTNGNKNKNNGKNEKNQSFHNDVTYLEDVNSYYNKAFASKLQASIVFEIIQVLTETFGISQVSKCIMWDCFISIDLPLSIIAVFSYSLFIFIII